MSIEEGGDWNGVLAEMQEEFKAQGQTQSMEVWALLLGQDSYALNQISLTSKRISPPSLLQESLIATSLRSISGSQRSSILTMFRSMALVPEDIAPPLEILQLLFQVAGASGDGSSQDDGTMAAPTMLSVRRWVKCLIGA